MLFKRLFKGYYVNLGAKLQVAGCGLRVAGCRLQSCRVERFGYCNVTVQRDEG